MSRKSIQPLLNAIPAVRQRDARHYGVHPYFTRRPPNVVRAYIERYSFEGDVVLDPFGGAGVTAVEAFLLGRRAMHNDLNPFANFIARNIADTTFDSTLPLRDAFERVERACEKPLIEIEAGETGARAWLRRLPLPENVRLPRNADAERYFDMFTPRQLAGLAAIKQAIDLESDERIRESLLLAWSASLAKLNKTFLSAKGRAESRGGSSIFSIYRYKLASQCVELPIWETFRGRFMNVLEAKEEVLQHQRYRQHLAGGVDRLNSDRDFRVLAHDAADLDRLIEPESVDYIFTDPPYGAHIGYLDLSMLWNHWLGFSVSDDDRAKETIVGGDLDLTQEHYKRSLAGGVETCMRLLRPDRWMSIVFQHWDSSYFSAILETACDSGAELKAAITQTGDVIWSMHKKKNSAGLLAGELILTFYKPAKPRRCRSARKIAAPLDADAVLSEAIGDCLVEGASSFTSEALFNRLVIELWRRRALDCFSLDRESFAVHLHERGWSYNPKTHHWSRREETVDCFR